MNTLIQGHNASKQPVPVRVDDNGSLQIGGSSFSIPAHDHIAIAYVGSTNNIDTVAYKTGGSGGTTVATLTITYVGGTPASDDAKLASVTLT